MVNRVFVERREGFDLEAERLHRDLRVNLSLDSIEKVRVIHRYDVEGIDDATLGKAMKTVFSEPQTDAVSNTVDFACNDTVFAFEYLPGQFDQRADSCEQCIAIISGGERPRVRAATVYCIAGTLSENDIAAIKRYIINPVDSREASLDKPETLAGNFAKPPKVAVLEGFTTCGDSKLLEYLNKYSLAMDTDDIRFCRDYFKNEEKRDPTMSELRLIDSYWSDHCRHTTFQTAIERVTVEDDYIAETYADYLVVRDNLKRTKDITLMDIATLAAKYLKTTGELKNLDESEEINACSVKVKVDVDGIDQDWLLMFKNETHNHPTEIEPFGGAATCLGGAIRDPLSGRAYVYQAMRVTGAADPRVPVKDTIPGKLPQSKLTVGAAHGYSSYGNQIGLATGGVYELYHPNYVAKRLEIGAVVGATPADHVVREVPEAGDVIFLLGGKTGRDGCGGATGSSKAHTSKSLETCGAEVQKGNPPEERKIQRLFRRPEVTRLIRRCNDFGAGGVSVTIGELADGLHIDLSKVPKKYEGLDGTELAISESQERMAVVVRASDAEKFSEYAASENLDATVVAAVTEQPRLVMEWNGDVTVDLSREFLNSNGAKKHTDIEVEAVDTSDIFSSPCLKGGEKSISDSFYEVICDLNVCSKRGLSERFDSSIGASTVVMPWGGKNQITAPRYMAAKFPVASCGGKDAATDSASYMAYGFDPYLSEISPYHGALYAVVESVAKLVAAGIPYTDAYLTFQEFFERTKGDPKRWGQPFAALLGAFKAQLGLKLGAIGGKDSMSGSFEDIDVPPTLVSFAIAKGRASEAVTPEFKQTGSKVALVTPDYDANGVVDFDSLTAVFEKIHGLITSGDALSVFSVGIGGAAEAVFNMSIGNGIGFRFDALTDYSLLFERSYGSFVLELKPDAVTDGIILGETVADEAITVAGERMTLSSLRANWERVLEGVFPASVPQTREAPPPAYSFTDRNIKKPFTSTPRPRVFIPVFPGTNCEYDTARAFDRAGGDPDIFVLCNRSAAELEASLEEMAQRIGQAQILMLPGGFSAADEPDGSGKFITAVLRNARVREAVTNLIENRGGLALGICNGFQALLKSGLLPYGQITDAMMPTDATLTFNTIGRHQSRMVYTRVASVKSPWFAKCSVGDVHVIPISHGEGRFIASDSMIAALAENGQIATQYTDAAGNPDMNILYNPNGSFMAIEGITSADGRILGKMGHSERTGANIASNIPGDQDQHLFESGVAYFA